MFRFVIAAVVAMCSFVAQADQKPDRWVTVAGKGDVTLDVNLANITYAKDKIKQHINVIGQFRYSDKTAKDLPPYQTFWVDAASCAVNSGILHGILEPGTEPVVTKWAVTGLTLYDRAGQTLCTYHNHASKEIEQKRNVQKYPI